MFMYYLFCFPKWKVTQGEDSQLCWRLWEEYKLSRTKNQKQRKETTLESKRHRKGNVIIVHSMAWQRALASCALTVGVTEDDDVALLRGWACGRGWQRMDAWTGVGK